MRYGEGPVVADVLTAWLDGVTGEVLLFVSPGRLGRSAQDQDAEDEQNGQPHLEQHGGNTMSATPGAARRKHNPNSNPNTNPGATWGNPNTNTTLTLTLTLTLTQP